MDVIELRRQVAIVGQVTDPRTGRALASVQVRLTNAPVSLVERLVTVAKGVRITDPALATVQAVLDNPAATTIQKLEAAQMLLDFLQSQRLFTGRRLDRAQTMADGFFFFTELPAGAYTLAATLTNGGARYGVGQATATVTSSNGNITLARADIALPATTLRGRITGPSLDGDGSVGPVPMAAVQVRGSGERAYSNAAGDYLLPALEIGQRRVMVAARGYRTHEQTVTFSEAGSEQVVNVALALPP